MTNTMNAARYHMCLLLVAPSIDPIRVTVDDSRSRVCWKPESWAGGGGAGPEAALSGPSPKPHILLLVSRPNTS